MPACLCGRILWGSSKYFTPVALKASGSYLDVGKFQYMCRGMNSEMGRLSQVLCSKAAAETKASVTANCSEPSLPNNSIIVSLSSNPQLFRSEIVENGVWISVALPKTSHSQPTFQYQSSPDLRFSFPSGPRLFGSQPLRCLNRVPPLLFDPESPTGQI